MMILMASWCRVPVSGGGGCEQNVTGGEALVFHKRAPVHPTRPLAMHDSPVGNWTLRLAAGINEGNTQLNAQLRAAASQAAARGTPALAQAMARLTGVGSTPPPPTHGRLTSMELCAMEDGVYDHQHTERGTEQAQVYSTLQQLGLNLAASVEDAANRAASYVSDEPLLPTQGALTKGSR